MAAEQPVEGLNDAAERSDDQEADEN